PVAVKVTGLPDKVPELAVNVFEPAVALRVQLPTVAMPLPLEIGRASCRERVPAAGVDVTVTSATGFPFASFTITDGGDVISVPGGAHSLVRVFGATVVCSPALPVAVKVTGLPDKVPELAVNVFEPAVALRVQLPTVAMPLPL